MAKNSNQRNLEETRQLTEEIEQQLAEPANATKVAQISVSLDFELQAYLRQSVARPPRKLILEALRQPAPVAPGLLRRIRESVARRR